MTPDYRLHYAPDNASLVIRLALLELDVPFTTVLVDRASRAHKSAEFRAINPVGRIPALETPDGIMFETGAILLWLVDKHGTLGPSPTDPDRANFLKWLFYVSNTLHANMRLNFYPDQYIADHFEMLRAGSEANLTEGLSLLNREASMGHDWLNGTEPSVLDLYLAASLRWMALYTNRRSNWFDLNDWPHLSELALRLEQRASVRTAIADEGLQDTPFSAPKPCNPPEGSAT